MLTEVAPSLNPINGSIFYEIFNPNRVSTFDSELNNLVCDYAQNQASITGICNLAASPTSFSTSSSNWREGLVATVSGSINRQRQLVCGLSLALLGSPHFTLPEVAAYINQHTLRIYTAEANSALFQAMQRLIAPDLLYYSEYFGENYKSGEIVNGLMHQDLQATSFADESFDIILTSDVFEHMPDVVRAEKEVARILKKGGVYCFTVPLVFDCAEDEILAELTGNNTIRFLTTPQYHVDPVRPTEGALVYRHFACAALQARFTALGCDFANYRFWSKALGMLGTGNIVQIVKKPHETPNVSTLTTDILAPISDATNAPLATDLVTLQTEKAYLQLLLNQRTTQLQQSTIREIELKTQLSQLSHWAQSMERELLAHQTLQKIYSNVCLTFLSVCKRPILLNVGETVIIQQLVFAQEFSFRFNFSLIMKLRVLF